MILIGRGSYDKKKGGSDEAVLGKGVGGEGGKGVFVCRKTKTRLELMNLHRAWGEKTCIF